MKNLVYIKKLFTKNIYGPILGAIGEAAPPCKKVIRIILVVCNGTPVISTQTERIVTRFTCKNVWVRVSGQRHWQFSGNFQSRRKTAFGFVHVNIMLLCYLATIPSPSVFWYFWLGDRKGIRRVKISHQQNPHAVLLDNLTSSNLSGKIGRLNNIRK